MDVEKIKIETIFFNDVEAMAICGFDSDRSMKIEPSNTSGLIYRYVGDCSMAFSDKIFTVLTYVNSTYTNVHFSHN